MIPRRRIVLLLDWDSTLTKNDTLAAIASVADGTKSAPAGLPGWWQDLVDAYISDFRAHKAEAEQSAADGAEVDKEENRPDVRLELQKERAWLASLKDVERRSFERGKATGQFRTVTADLLESQVERLMSCGQIQMRDGWNDLLFKLHDAKVGIVSVNWSRAFIGQCLKQEAKQIDANALLSTKIKDLDVAANEIFSQLVGTEAEIGIHTSGDKLSAAEAMIAQVPEPRTVIYLGDSITDLDCLLRADIGICIRDETMSSGQRELAATLERIGLAVNPLSEFSKSSSSGHHEGEIPELWWTSSLIEVSSLLERQQITSTFSPP